MTTAKRKKGALPWPAVAAPHDCSILSVDPGEVSGWHVRSRGKIVAYGHVDIFADPTGIDRAFDYLIECPGPHAVVVERPFGAKRGKGGHTFASVGAGYVTWCRRAALRGLKKIVRVFPATWRSKILPKETSPDGKGWHAAKRKDVRLEEQRIAIAILRKRFHPVTSLVQADVAPSVCIGEWAELAGEVLEKLNNKPRAKRSKDAA